MFAYFSINVLIAFVSFSESEAPTATLPFRTSIILTSIPSLISVDFSLEVQLKVQNSSEFSFGQLK